MQINPYIVLGSAVVGFLVGLTGAGGGALMTPMLILLFGIKPSTAISSDLVAAVVMRPVGADSVGYLSPTKGRPTVYFDIGYHHALVDTGIYPEVEKLLLACEGRCSWSRLFKAPMSEVVKQYPQYQEFVQAKREMDPCNVFSNAFSDAVLSAAGPPAVPVLAPFLPASVPLPAAQRPS